MGKDDENINIKNIVENTFNFIYKGKYKEKLFSRPEKFEDNFILDNLVKNEKLPLKAKNEKNCDEVFYEYLSTFKNKTNEKYFTLLLKFILLFRECFDVNKNKNINDEIKQQFSNKLTPEQLPDLCNDFYGDFLDSNDCINFPDISYTSTDTHELLCVAPPLSILYPFGANVLYCLICQMSISTNHIFCISLYMQII